jgi:magnesium transporter
LAVGEVRFDDLGTVILREARVGLLLGAMLGLLALGPTWIFVGRRSRWVVSLTCWCVCTLAAFVGSLLPLVARRIGLDPAVMSAPFISTLVGRDGPHRVLSSSRRRILGL